MLPNIKCTRLLTICLCADTYLDSDGKYSFSGLTTASPGAKNVSDGAWHMVTVTTHTDARHGYLLYVDGQMAGKLHEYSFLPYLRLLQPFFDHE